MRVSRRDVLRTGLAVGVAAVGLEVAAGWDESSLASPADTTLESTLLHGAPGRGGYAPVQRLAGEAHIVRTDLGVAAGPAREDRRRPLLALAHLTDVHIVDAQSPMRVEPLDRYVGGGLYGRGDYRPHEMLAPHVADAMVRAVAERRVGPVTGAPLALALQTGDNSDNAQHNELRWGIDLLDGGRIRPDSGDLTRWEGVASSDDDWWDPHYWHPDGPLDGQTPDLPRLAYGFPVVPGLLDAARATFVSGGLGIPWYSAYGNHDGLVGGSRPITPARQDVAVGDRKLISPPPGMALHDLTHRMAHDLGPILHDPAYASVVRTVTDDPSRRPLDRAGYVDEHFNTTGTPVGHGFTDRNRAEGTAYYTVDHGPVRLVVLDTVNPQDGPHGSLDVAQFAWLERVLLRSRDRIVVLASHHTSSTMTAAGGPDRRVHGPQVLALALRHRHVVAWLNGHKHRNEIWAHRRPGGGGFWEVNTASHIDWPMQSRVVEIVDNRDGTLSIFTTMLDHEGPSGFDGRMESTLALAGLARQLAANDWQERHSGRRGRRQARNVELLVRRP
ncbi:MAG: TIGR03767 family metallophosphoesterase [Nocardioidaceae bacterium]